jgi:ribosomal protein S16
MSRDQNAGQNHNIKTDNKPIETVDHFKYLRTTITNTNCILEEIKSRLESGNVYCHSVQNILSSILLSKI